MRLDTLQQHWQAFGERDPLWAVLTEDQKKDNRWTVDDFMASGEQLVGWYVGHLKALGVAPRFGRALDFGCGVGRVTQGLAGIAGDVTGIDIAPAMVARARECNRHGSRCRYVVNERDDLRAFADGEFDLVHSTIVLQHMHPIYQRRYVAELMRVLKPGGVLILQAASDRGGQDAHGAASRAVGPLPAVACRARVTGLGVRLVLPALGLCERRVTVENLGKSAWPALGDGAGRFQVKLGTRWRRWTAGSAGQVVHEGMRTVLPGDVAPRTPTQLPLAIDAPEEPGHYLLEVDLLQEDVGWFADRGPSSPLLVSTVLTREPPALSDSTEPEMEMYAVARPELTRLLQRCGAELVHALPSDASGPGFCSHYYFVRKGG